MIEYKDISIDTLQLLIMYRIRQFNEIKVTTISETIATKTLYALEIDKLKRILQKKLDKFDYCR